MIACQSWLPVKADTRIGISKTRITKANIAGDKAVESKDGHSR